MVDTIKRLLSVSSEDKSRSAVVDFWRGAAMLCVMIQHNKGLPVGIVNFLLAFHMPFFFILSGFMLSFAASLRRYTVKEYICKRSQQLMLPYFFAEIVFLLAFLAYYGKDVNICATLCSILAGMNMEDATGYRFWFFPCLLISDLTVFLLLKRVKKNWVLLLAAGVSLLGSWMITQFNIGALPYALDISFMAIPFVILGYLAAPVISRIKDAGCASRLRYLLLALLLGCICYMCSLYNSPFWMFINEYGNYGFAVPAAVAGSGFLFLFSICIYREIPCIRNVIVWCGRNSLCLFPIHCLVLYVLFAAGRLVEMPAALRLLIMFVTCIPIANIVSTYIPFMAGRCFYSKNKT